MASTLDFIEYVCGQIEGVGSIRYRKMFGEYMVYVNEKPMLLICDNTVFLKMLPCLDELCADCERGYPYKGAKEHYILDIDNADISRQIVSTAEPATPLPKPKKSNR